MQEGTAPRRENINVKISHEKCSSPARRKRSKYGKKMSGGKNMKERRKKKIPEER
jgi:hypothetical protein